ncbi:gamma carbonic anhydrase family protein [Gryllotalpicola sp.]|uniref:gamma carbonic anhydrase family protein n=1 Tax=Gryllotalpicola sp. TaxID=1932787 RepID=UPI0026085570|nr:gamma carbonic anhydrase family protein [Gryllotalpicola sp.]
MTRLTLPIGSPAVDPTAYVAPGAVLIGAVRLAADSSVWFNAVLRADDESIILGERSNLQDLVACHADDGIPLTVGAGVSVGHSAVLHGCTIEDDVLVGMHATIMNRAVIGHESLIAAGALVSEGKVIPPRSLVAGVPGKVIRELTDAEVESIHENARHYVERGRLFASSAGD